MQEDRDSFAADATAIFEELQTEHDKNKVWTISFLTNFFFYNNISF